MHSRIPAILQPLFQLYLSRISEQLPGLLQGFYLEGSVALGGFNERLSDIDFIAFLTGKITKEEIQVLGKIHQFIEQTYSWKLSGTYYPVEDLLRWENPLAAQLHYHDGVLGEDQRQFDLDSVEGWILKKHGISLLGPSPQTLPFLVNWGILLSKMHLNLNAYWAGWTRQPHRILTMLSDWGIQWTVLGVLRQYYSFREHSITTKVKAGEYALSHLPSCWHRLIREAISIREGSQQSAYPCRVSRMIEAQRFLRSVIQTCNKGFS